MPWKKNFDVDEALQRAGETFWTQGYESTSMNDLLAAMGIQKGSFYDTYGSKRDAYLRALGQYTRTRFDEFDALIVGQPPKQALRTLIDAIYEECAGQEGHRGCMLINCALELAHSDIEAQRIVQSGLETHEASYAELIRAGQASGELSGRARPGRDGQGPARPGDGHARVLALRSAARHAAHAGRPGAGAARTLIHRDVHGRSAGPPFSLL